MHETIPDTQRAVQLTGPDQLRLNEHKPVPQPGPHQVLARVEVTGLCFSDLKLLKQFEGHVRKSAVLDGLDDDVLRDIPGYVPGAAPTVPGHETVVRVVTVGELVQTVKPGDRRLVQADYRWLRTAHSNAAFGYNFEGALQEYVLLDERVFLDPDGCSTLLPAPDDLPASAIALAEPWACVEDAYVTAERRAARPDGRACTIDCSSWTPETLAEIPDESLDDVVFLGSDADLLEAVFRKLANNSLLNIVQRGARFGRPVRVPVGRLHYGGVRITGTTGDDPAGGYAAVPPNGEIRPGTAIHVVGAAGPMGTMHVIRNLCQGVPGITLYAGDTSDERLARLQALSEPLARTNGVKCIAYNAVTDARVGPFDYTALMVPVPALVAASVLQSAPHGVINIFAGIAADVWHPIDLDAYIEKQLYFIGTSGSTIDDMKIVLAKVVERRLDTNLSVAAVSGLDGAIDGIRAVEKQGIPGKILVYPSCRGLKLTPLQALDTVCPETAAGLREGAWTGEAERALLRAFGEEVQREVRVP